MIGGEGPADARWMVKGAWIEYAIIFNALCIQLEHRYYGESHPTKLVYCYLAIKDNIMWICFVKQLLLEIN